jgi:hypothetical protein
MKLFNATITRGLAFTAFAVAFGLLGSLSVATAQDKGQILKAKDQGFADDIQDGRLGRRRAIVVSGYTRPGWPDDRMEADREIILSRQEGFKGRIMGGTVYFAVFERNEFNPDGDKYGTGVSGLDDNFVEGRSTTGRYSPAFEGKGAKYLYVYQVVNDRGQDPHPILTTKNADGSYPEIRTDDIFSLTLRLLCDPADISSWGYFKNLSFAARVADTNLAGDIVQAKAGEEGSRNIRMAFSSEAPILRSLPYHLYTSRSPAYPLSSLRVDFGLDKSTLGLKNATSYSELENLKKGAAKLASWQENHLAAVLGAKEPTFVELAAAEPEFDAALLGKGEMLLDQGGLSRLNFRADFRGKNILKPGQSSVVFGFTSNLPPVETDGKLFSQPPMWAAGLKADGIGIPKGRDGIIEGKGIPDAKLGGGEGKGVIEAKGGIPAGKGLLEAKGIGPVPQAEGNVAGAGGIVLAAMALPTPAPAQPAAAVGGGPGGGFWVGQQTPGFVGGGGTPGFGGGVGSIGTAPAPIISGGGGTNSGSNGTPSTNGTTSTGSGSGSNGTNTSGQNQTINFNPTLINQQQQQQAQFQIQAQAQAQVQGRGTATSTTPNTTVTVTTNSVVPEPAAIVLGALGVPALLVMLRRRKTGGASLPATS